MSEQGATRLYTRLYRIGQLPWALRMRQGEACVSCHPYVESDDDAVWVIFFRAEGGQLYLTSVTHEMGASITVPEWESRQMTDHDMWELMVGYMQQFDDAVWNEINRPSGSLTRAGCDSAPV
jgi:hypothetical protein